MCRTRKKNWFLSKNARLIDIPTHWMYNSYTSKRYAPFGALLVSVLWDLTARWCWSHQVADTVYPKSWCLPALALLLSVIKNTTPRRRCQEKNYHFVLKKAKKRKYELQFKSISDIICEKIEVQDELNWFFVKAQPMRSCSAIIWNEQQDGSLSVNRRRAYPFEQQNKMKKSHGIKRTTTICWSVQ